MIATEQEKAEVGNHERQRRIETRLREMDEDFTSRVDKLENQVKENRSTMHGLRDDVNTMNRTLQDQIKLMEKLVKQQIPELPGERR